MIDTTIEIALTVFVMLMLIAQLIALRFKVPYTVVLVFIGIGVTVLSTAALGAYPLSGILQVSIQWIRALYGQLVGTGLFVGLVVPPLIFEAMIHIKRDELRSVIRPALVLATVGVLLSTAVVAVAVWKIEGISLFSSLLFAAIIAPTDTITVLQIFKYVKVPSKLSTLMDLEAAFNDATAIVLFTVILSSSGLHSAQVLSGAEFFVYSFVGGITIGLVVAAMAKLVHSRVNDKLAGTTLTIAAVYGSYVLSTSLGASGLIAVAIVGLYFGNSTTKAVTKSVKRSITSFWEMAAFVGNAVAFLLIGFDTNLSLFFQASAVIIVAYVSTLVARVITVYPIFTAFSGMGRKLPRKWGSVATLGGVRGALSIALLATLAYSGVVSSYALSTITAMVLGVVFISIIVQVPLLSRYAGMFFGRHSRPVDLS